MTSSLLKFKGAGKSLFYDACRDAFVELVEKLEGEHDDDSV